MEFILIGLGTYLDVLIFNEVAIAASCLGAVVVAIIMKKIGKHK